MFAEDDGRGHSTRVEAARSDLRDRGLRSGDVVIICLPPGDSLRLALGAVSAAGGVIVTMEPVLEENVLRKRIATSGARMMITDSEVAIEAAGESRIRQILSSQELLSP